MANGDNERLDLTELQATLRERNAGWIAAETPLSQLPIEEKARRLGAVPPAGVTLEEIAARARDVQAAIATEKAIGAPSAYDLRNVNGQNFITPIKDQGNCGSCVAFGTCAAIEGTYHRQQNNPNLQIDLSEAQLFYCHGRAQGRNCTNGWIPNQALATCQDPGIADEACYPYTAGDQNCSHLCADWRNRVVQVTGFHAITSTAQMKEWISTRGPLTAYFVVYNDFYSYSSGVYRHVTGMPRGEMQSK